MTIWHGGRLSQGPLVKGSQIPQVIGFIGTDQYRKSWIMELIVTMILKSGKDYIDEFKIAWGEDWNSHSSYLACYVMERFGNHDHHHHHHHHRHQSISSSVASISALIHFFYLTLSNSLSLDMIKLFGEHDGEIFKVIIFVLVIHRALNQSFLSGTVNLSI